MSTAAASVAARNAANAQNSTGPATAEGKARSAQNARTHGLTARTVVLPHENKEEYEALKKDFARKYRPAGILEQQMVARMLDCWWILNRALRVESEFYLQRGAAITEANPDLTGDAALVNFITDPEESKRFRLLMRYVNAARNAWRQAKSDFEKMRAADAEESLEQTWLSMMTDREEETTSPTPSESGFVSHPQQTAPPTPPQPAASADHAPRC